jgi:hypothetical protein
MSKSRKSKSSRKGRGSVMKRIRRTTYKTLPVVNKGLMTVGTTAKNVASASIPVVEKGVGVVYGTMATGLDLGVKGVKSVSKNISKRNGSSARSRSLALSGGRRTKRRH